MSAATCCTASGGSAKPSWRSMNIGICLLLSLMTRSVPAVAPLRLLCIVAGAIPVDDHDRLVADDPGIVARGQQGNLARARFKLRAVGHLDVEAPRTIRY